MGIDAAKIRLSKQQCVAFSMIFRYTVMHPEKILTSIYSLKINYSIPPPDFQPFPGKKTPFP